MRLAWLQKQRHRLQSHQWKCLALWLIPWMPSSKGKWSATTGLTSADECTICGLDTFNPDVGQTSEAACTKCLTGKFSAEGAMLDSDCKETACPLGEYNLLRQSAGATTP